MTEMGKISKFERFSSSVAEIYQYIQKIQRAEMGKFGLKGSHTQCLVVMCRYPEGITVTQLCAACEKDKASVSRSVSELEKAGLLRRLTLNGQNAYRASLVLTEQGEKAAQQVLEKAQIAADTAGAELQDEQREIFYNALNTIADNLKRIYRDGIQENGMGEQ